MNHHEIPVPDWFKKVCGSRTICLSMFTSLSFDWALAEAENNSAQQHHCWAPNNEDAWTTTKLLQINLPWQVYIFCFRSSKIYLSMLTSFFMTEHWLKQPKMLPCYMAFKWKTIKMHQPTQNSFKKTFLDWCRNKFGSSKIFLSMFNSFYYNWALAEAAKNDAQPHCCWAPKNDYSTTTNLLQINLSCLV